MKATIRIAAILLSLANYSLAQSFVSDDIQGRWQSTKPGAELFIEISGPNAKISSLGSAKLPKAILGGMMYEEIIKSGATAWTARRNAWQYSMADETNGEKGRWEKANTVTLTLSADKNTLYASGHWTFRRPEKFETSVKMTVQTQRGTTEVEENFDGTSAKFRVIASPTRPPSIFAEIKNNTKDKLAIVLIRLANGKLKTEYLEPGFGLQRNYPSPTMEIQVIYRKYEPDYEPIEITEFVKGQIRKKVTTEKGRPKVSPGYTGVRG